MIDTHTHLYFEDFNEDWEDLIERSKSVGVTHFVLPNVDENSLPLVKDFHSHFPDCTSMAIGLHPTEVKENWKEIIKLFEKEVLKDNYIAIGEVGMDLYWDTSGVENQKKAFEYQIRIASDLNLPVIIHSRNALDTTLEIIDKNTPKVPLVFHSFTGNCEDVKKIRNICDPYFGINGVVTYKNAPELREALNEIGLNRIILETDSPYLTPVPHRGKRNESAYLTFVRDKIAETLNLSSEVIEEGTIKNSRDIFKI